MASRKDPRRPDLVIPYVEPEKEKEQSDVGSTLAQTMPMAALFTRNKMAGWVSVIFSLQQWLAETPEQKLATSTPAYFSVIMSAMAIAACYLPLFLPPMAPRGTPSGAQPPVPPSH